MDALAGNDIMMNPPFFLAEEFIDVALAAFAQDPNTRCLFILPHGPDEANKKLEKHEHARVVAWYTPKAKLFLRCKPGKPMSEARLKADPYKHIIIAWELNQKPVGKELFKIAKLPNPSKDQLGEWKRFAKRLAKEIYLAAAEKKGLLAESDTSLETG